MGIFDCMHPTEPEGPISENTFADYLLSLSEKCEDGGLMDALDSSERTVYLVTRFDNEVKEGGFAQYFYNTSCRWTEETIAALNEVGAYETAELFRHALNVTEGDLPTGDERENSYLDRMLDETAAAALEACDGALETCKEDLSALCQAYLEEQGRELA